MLTNVATLTCFKKWLFATTWWLNRVGGVGPPKHRALSDSNGLHCLKALPQRANCGCLSPKIEELELLGYMKSATLHVLPIPPWGSWSSPEQGKFIKVLFRGSQHARGISIDRAIFNNCCLGTLKTTKVLIVMRQWCCCVCCCCLCLMWCCMDFFARHTQHVLTTAGPADRFCGVGVGKRGCLGTRELDVCARIRTIVRQMNAEHWKKENKVDYLWTESNLKRFLPVLPPCLFPCNFPFILNCTHFGGKGVSLFLQN